MRSTKVIKVFSFLSLFVLMSLACDLSVTVASPTNPAPFATNTAALATEPPTQILLPSTTNPPTLAPNPTATALQPAFEGVEVTIDPLSIVLSPELASGARGLQIPRAEGEEVAPWEVTPGHAQIKLEGYPLQGKFHEPQIYVYPAQEYAEMYPPAFESIRRFDNILYTPGGPSLNADTLLQRRASFFFQRSGDLVPKRTGSTFPDRIRPICCIGQQP